MTTNIQALDPNANTPLENTPNPEIPEDVVIEELVPASPKGEKEFPPSTPEDLMRVPEIRDLVEAARTQEKTKLYKTIAARDLKIKELTEKVKELEGAINVKDNESLIEVGLLQEEIGKLRGQVEKLVLDAEAEREEAQKKQKKSQLEAYKERRLRELKDNGENVVLVLVKGESEEELEASIETAKEEYRKIFEEAVQSTTTQQPRQEQPRVTNLPRVTNPPAGNNTPFSSRDVKGMDTKEYGKNREKLLKLAREGNLAE